MAKVVLFSLGGQLYGVDALRVRSIERLQALRPFPVKDRRVLGIVHIRGDVMPVVDLARILGMNVPPDRECRRLLIMEAGGGEVAFAVDTVREVSDVDVKRAALSSVFDGIGKGNALCVEGALLWHEEILLLLRPDSLLGREAAAELSALAGGLPR